MILITGANGWLGSNLIKLIIENKTEKWGLKKQKIIAFVEKKTNYDFLKKYKSNEIEIFEGNLTSQDEIKNFLSKSDNSTLIHTAGVIHPKKYNDFKKINFEVVKNILQNLKKYSIIKSIFISSNSVMGFNKNSQEPFYENTKTTPYLGYGVSKKLMENEIHKHMHKNNISIIRAPWFYGLNQPNRQIEFLNMIKNNKFPIIGNGNNLRSMVYIDNLIQGISRVASNEKSKGQTYWIADEKPYSMNIIIKTVKNIYREEYRINISDKNFRLPNFVSKISRIIDFCLQFAGLYNTKIHVLGEMNMNIFCSIDKAKKDLKYMPEFSLKEGMKKSISEIYE